MINLFNHFRLFILNKHKDKDSLLYEYNLVTVILFSLICHLIGLLVYFGLTLFLNLLLIVFEGLRSTPPDKVNSPDEQLALLGIILFTCLIAPLNEEMLFRYPLRFKRYSIPIFIGFLGLTMTIASYTGINRILTLNLSEWFQDRKSTLLVFLLLTSMSLLIFYNLKEKIIRNINSFWRKHNYKIMIFLCVLFALMHNTLPFYLVNVPWILASISRPFISGLCYSFIRLEFGMSYVFVSHFIWNALLMIPLIYSLLN